MAFGAASFSDGSTSVQDYVVDFSPFWPITQGTLDARFGDQVGGLLGVSLFQLQALWFFFAVSTWVIAFFLYRVFRDLGAPSFATIAPNHAMERTSDRPAPHPLR